VAPLSAVEKVFLVIIVIVIAVGFLAEWIDARDKLQRERNQWHADVMRRTELCEAQGGIPRYQVRGQSYDGCDFPPKP
jgi:hypothetical protein